ncbi:Flagellar biosynthetic protein FlhB [Aquimixticola soesokkakensis]|uniref:Flagellar biosynthetic protein FlhB n=1 Tax=Aquimixticola soesokkakensis TaxID=1519096 RepID=A0A1Y5RBX7_9RHOB|nr:flagellar type III secretion system protein FlhB [Aquimixticola soesokkakensis]SLN13053.1 Flagellar biosynthetic protein FlhB [Aquimixticola soesokkakensis]
MSEEDDGDKQYEASAKKLDDARKRGEIPRSADLTTVASYAGFLLVGLVFGGASLNQIATVLEGFIANADTWSAVMFAGPAAPMAGGMGLALLKPLIPWLTIPALCAILSLIATRSFVFAPTKLEPKLSKISPISNAKNKFGRSGLFEFAKSATKLTIYSIILGYFLSKKLPDILMTLALSPAMITVELLTMCLDFFGLVLVVALVISGVDYLFQYNDFLRKNRMSRKEMVDESKNQEGDPHTKQKRRQRGYDIAMNQMLAEVPKADVIVVNPTHYAVALKWDRRSGGAPVCVAKGVDEIAAKIREIANDSRIPIHRDPPTARALYATVDIGAEILPEHYRAVAASIRFAEAMRAKVKRKIHRTP